MLYKKIKIKIKIKINIFGIKQFKDKIFMYIGVVCMIMHSLSCVNLLCKQLKRWFPGCVLFSDRTICYTYQNIKFNNMFSLVVAS